MSFQQGANLYTQGFGSRPESVEIHHIETRDHSITDSNYPVGKRWLNTSTEQEFVLYRFQVVNGVTQAVWGTPVGASTGVVSLSDQVNTKVLADVTGNIQLQGTSNQIQTVANPSSHSITSSFTNGISIGSYQSTTPPAGGILAPGLVVLGTNTPVGNTQLQVNVGLTLADGIAVTGTINGVDGSANQSCYVSNCSLHPTVSNDYSTGMFPSPVFITEEGNTTNNAFTSVYEANISSNAGTITTCGNILTLPGSVSGTPAVNAYGAYFNNPVFGSGSNTAAYTDNLSVGYPNTSPPTNGAFIAGQTSIGTTTPDARAFTTISANTSFPWSLNTTGVQTTIIGGPGGNQIFVFDNTTSLPNGNCNFAVCFNSNTRFSTNLGNTTTNAFCFFGNPFVQNNNGIITNVGTYYSAAGSLTGTPAINAYGAYFNTPVVGGTSNTALYADNLSIGFSGTSPPTNGAFIKGQLSIGDTVTDNSSIFSMISTTRGFLPPRMTTVQKNAIPLPATGLVVYDTTLNQLSYFNSSAWVNI